ncbi:hypothetical protein [Olleya sp. 1-3]|uniref:hypothetical protein n=1 Tax=Olleya sp. 1-3 TaxID=2058323 RepID=UPI000C34663D|nr:hypothetical protein [Olleya sp. 1-3]PKG51713.1 hypothetical protein CXF54_06860 [Olleya sp. 1-3]
MLSNTLKFLIIVQDLRVSGTSEGIVSRSFIANLRKAYPESIIDLFYVKSHSTNDDLKLLNVNSIEEHTISKTIPFTTRWINKIYWRLFHRSLKELHIQNNYKKLIEKINYKSYNHVFVRSSGLEYETILACHDLPILNEAIINFHDPYPNFWDTGSNVALESLELFRLKRMKYIVDHSKLCITPSSYLSKDMTLLYGSSKVFKTLPHQFNKTVFNLEDHSSVRKKEKKCSICYHGTLQLGRDMDIVLEAYLNCINRNDDIKRDTEFVLRLKSNQYGRLKEKYKAFSNIIVLEASSFSNSYNEQNEQSDVVVVLENNLKYSNILPGKIPAADAINSQVFNVCPEESETRHITTSSKFIATSNDKYDITNKLEQLLINQLQNRDVISPFGDYFSDKKFKEHIDNIIN